MPGYLKLPDGIYVPADGASEEQKAMARTQPKLKKSAELQPGGRPAVVATPKEKGKKKAVGQAKARAAASKKTVPATAPKVVPVVSPLIVPKKERAHEKK